ncbi:xylulokinase [Ramlibacter sp. WS9]|uniref:xylulokinase n=1 Tax=Ramlibacter sp. WS9 TaxID=1882741 RepID=UPI0011427E26|nr:xylulokinase [Ramlibacter sp. WS9]ROZ77594.1 xylulokinase [Ramlibacter sp. WS9]
MFLGIDLGTSSVKAVVLDRSHRLLASGSAPLAVDAPQPLWREQNPAEWWRACDAAVGAALEELRRGGVTAGQIEAIGLTGQMHGATLLDEFDEVLRPAILWNDGRAAAECTALEQAVPRSREITGNLMMPGFTAPKLLWVAKHEPRLFDRVRRVLLPKDWLRWRMTGDYATDLSDAAGTMWLDVGKREWSDELLSACGLSTGHMPRLHEGPEVTGTLLPELAQRWGLREIPVVAGASDNAAGALGAGVVNSGDAMMSLGTSGVVFVATGAFVANPQQAVHSFCHALPRSWHLMSVMLSAASCLEFTAGLLGERDVGALLAQAEQRGLRDDTPLFLPYLSGERTPHNNPHAKAVFFGMHAGTQREDMVNATLEGVCLGMAQGIAALQAVQPGLERVSLIGGGSRNAYWAQMMADATGLNVVRHADAEVGPSLGAARLAWLACEPDGAAHIFRPLEVVDEFEPRSAERARMLERTERFEGLYRSLESHFKV